MGSGDLCRGGAVVVAAQSRGAEIYDHHRAGRPRHDQGGAERFCPAGAGERGYQLALTRHSGARASANPESRDSGFEASPRPGMTARSHQIAANFTLLPYGARSPYTLYLAKIG